MKETDNAKTQQAPAEKKKTSSGGSKGSFWKVLKLIWHYIYKFRAVLISIPVLVVAIMQALKNSSRLPDLVGINLLANGEYAMTVTRTTAVLVPMLITLACIVLTCCSKRTLFPWLISIFTLVLPILIWLTNIYPM